MVYDTTAKKVGVKAIATVESNNDYGAINYNDPITVGVVQWFGTRAAGLLTRMRVENPAAWHGVATSLDNNLKTIDRNDSYWNGRYLTNAEGSSLVPVLNNNKIIQNTQIVVDFEAYKAVAISYGFNPDTNTKTVLFFFTMHHQSPASALRVVSKLDTECTLEQIRDGALADPTLGQYPNRQNEAYSIINAYDPSGIEFDESEEPQPPIPPTGGDGNGSANTVGNINYVHTVGNNVVVRFKDGQLLTLMPDGRGYFRPASVEATPPPPDPGPEPEPDPEPVGKWVHPLPESIITSDFGPRPFDGVASYHYGTDFSTVWNGNSVRACTDMRITVAADGVGINGSGGTCVKAHSLDGKYTFNHYHLVYGSLQVNVGQVVTAGTVLGLEGATGNVTGRHLHFEVYTGVHNDPWPPPYGPMPIDPVPLLRANGVNV